MGTIKATYDIILGLVDRLKNAAIKNTNQEMCLLVCDINKQMWEYQKEIDLLIAENKELKLKMQQMGELSNDIRKISNGAIVRISESEIDASYCTTCYENENKIRKLTKFGARVRGYYCPYCKSEFGPISLLEERQKIETQNKK